MKRIFILTIALLGLSVAASAQDTYYAELLGRNNYYGTARSTALGNAMTALGGDLGSIGINPAGSAVNSFGQFTITPALLFQNTGVAWSADGSENFDPASKTSHTKFNIPNIGGTMVMYTGRNYGIKHVTFGFVANTSNTYLNYTIGRGVNNTTSFLGNMAAAATGEPYTSFGNDLYTSYCANQIGEYGPEGSYVYAGANQRIANNEKYHFVPGTLNQTAEYNTYGSKTDLVLNLGFNVSDEFYFGFNLGMPMLEYRREETFLENPESPEQFPVIFYDKDGGKVATNFQSSSNSYRLNTSASGVYAKFGFIWLPTGGLRIGAAIQTPSSLTVEEQWQYKASTSYSDKTFNGSATSDIGEYSYKLRTPYIVNAGVAYTFGTSGFVSLDYELADYSVMKYRDFGETFYEAHNWSSVNYANSIFCGVSHSLRAGVEVKPAPEFALRAGFSMVTDPEKYGTDQNGRIITPDNWEGIQQDVQNLKYFKNLTTAWSAGIGYSSDSPFFADAAVRLTNYPVNYYSPYYYGAYDVIDSEGMHVATGMPLEKLSRSIFDVVLTLGWRF